MTFRRNISSLLVSDMLHWFSYGIYYAYITLYMYVGGLDYVTIGIYNSFGFFSYTLGNIIGGILTDKIGRKRSLLIGRMILPLVFIIIVFMKVEYVFLAFFISGLGNSITSIAREAFISEHLPKRKRGFYYNLINSIAGLAYGMGSYYASRFVAEKGTLVGFRESCITAIFLMTSASFIILLIREVRITKEEKRKIPFRELFERKTLILTSFVVVFFVGLEFIWTYISIYAVERLGITEENWGIIQALMFLVNTILSPILGKISDKIPIRISLYIGSACVMIFSLLLAFPLSRGSVYFTALILIDIIGEGFLWPAFFKFEIMLTEPEKRGKIFGVVGAITETIRGVLSPVIGKIYEQSKSMLSLPLSDFSSHY